MSIRDTLAINLMQKALEDIRSSYARPGDAENRRDQIKTFMASIFEHTASLAQDEEADGDCIYREVMSVHEAIDAAFMDVIERDDNAEPRGQAYSTLNIEDQGMFKP